MIIVTDNCFHCWGGIVSATKGFFIIQMDRFPPQKSFTNEVEKPVAKGFFSIEAQYFPPQKAPLLLRWNNYRLPSQKDSSRLRWNNFRRKRNVRCGIISAKKRFFIIEAKSFPPPKNSLLLRWNSFRLNLSEAPLGDRERSWRAACDLPTWAPHLWQKHEPTTSFCPHVAHLLLKESASTWPDSSTCWGYHQDRCGACPRATGSMLIACPSEHYEDFQNMCLMLSPLWGLHPDVASPDFGEETTAELVMGTPHSSVLLEGTLSTLVVHPVPGVAEDARWLSLESMVLGQSISTPS